MLALQRAAGNRAVAQLVGGSRLPTRRLQRFVGWEHERIGNKGSVAQCRSADPARCRTAPIMIKVAPGVSLTWGQVVALAGDEFETVEERSSTRPSAVPRATATTRPAAGCAPRCATTSMTARPGPTRSRQGSTTAAPLPARPTRAISPTSPSRTWITSPVAGVPARRGCAITTARSRRRCWPVRARRAAR